MLLTDEQLHEIREIIRRHHNAFVANYVGMATLPQETLDELEARGLLDPEMAAVNDAYLFGQLVGQLESGALDKMTYEQFKSQLPNAPIALTDVERRASDWASHHAGQFIVGLGERVVQQADQFIVAEESRLRQQMRERIEATVSEAVEKRKSARTIRSSLGWATGDWQRDFDRIAVTEKQQAMQNGVADNFRARFDDPWVAKIPMPNACEHCIRLHTVGGIPRIFRLSWLEANGSNFGKKAKDWKAVVGTVHPHCQCQLVRVPDGWGFDEDGDLVPGGELGVRYQSHEEMARAIADEFDLVKAYETSDLVWYQGIPVLIENRPGTVRKWTDPDGTPGETYMLLPYGYVRSTTGADEDEIDVYLGPDPGARQVYIIHQLDPDTGSFDEDKCFLGFIHESHAVDAYLAHMTDLRRYGGIQAMDIDAFKRWVGITKADRGEMMKAGVHPAEAAARDWVAGAWPKSYGTAANYEGKAPRPAPPIDVVDPEELRDRMTWPETKAGKQDPQAWDMGRPAPRQLRYVIPLEPSGLVGSGWAEENRERIDRVGRKNLMRPKPKARNVDPDDELAEVIYLDGNGGLT